MYQAVKGGDLTTVQRIIADDPSKLDATCTKNKKSPLVWACAEACKQAVIAKWLIQKGAILDLIDNEGCSALMLACCFNQPKTAELLNKKGAELNLVDNKWL